MKPIILKLAVFLLTWCSTAALAQPGYNILRRAIERKADEAVENAITKKKGDAPVESESGKTRSRARNNSGEGLTTTPPDVKEHLTEAEKSYKDGKYSEARYAVRQAMQGVEMEIGHKILKSLPEKIGGLPKDAEMDKVASSGWGWVGLTIQRLYSDSQDKEFTVSIANNAIMLSAVNGYLTNGTYVQTSSGEGQNWKQTKVKGFKGVIEYDEDAGYKLSVPLGQSSILICEGVNFKNEQEMLSAASALDLEGIKKMLGEQ